MQQRFEYKFVRLSQIPLPGFSWIGVVPVATKEAMRDYPEVVRQHAEEGWRLVQIFTPGTHLMGQAGYLELIFERLFEPSRPPDREETVADPKIVS